MEPRTIKFDIKKAFKSSWGAFLVEGLLFVVLILWEIWDIVNKNSSIIIIVILVVVQVVAVIWQLLLWRSYKKYVIEMTEEGIKIVGCGRRIVGMKKEKVDDISLRWDQVQKVAMESIYATDGSRYTIDKLYTSEMSNIWKEITAYYDEIKDV